MVTDPTNLSLFRVQAVRTAGGSDLLRRTLADLSDADIRHLARSLEFQAILDGAPSELLSRLRPRLRQLRPGRVASVERMCWQPLQRFLTDQPEAVAGAPWIVPRRLLRPLWQLIEAANADLVDQLRRRHLTAVFDRDRLVLEQVSDQVVDLAAFILNNATNIPARLRLSAAETATVRFMARVLKWHRLVMPSVQHFQRLMSRQTDEVQALRLHSNWFTVIEQLDTQFDLYVLYLFEIMPHLVSVIDAFPFYFDTLTEAQGLAVQWLCHHLDRVAAEVATLLSRPPRSLSADALLSMADQVSELNKLTERLRHLPLFGPKGAAAGRLEEVLQMRLGLGAIDQLGQGLHDWLHEATMGTTDERMRAATMLAPLSATFPTLLSLVDTGEEDSRVAKLRRQFADRVVEEVERFLRSHSMAPNARLATANAISPLLSICRDFGQAEAVKDLERRLRR